MIQEIGKLQAEIQSHRQVAPIVHARPDPRLLNKEMREQGKKKYVYAWEQVVVSANFFDRKGKAAEIGGLHRNWKERAQVPSRLPPAAVPSISQTASAAQPPTKSRTGHQDPDPNPIGDGDDMDAAKQVEGGEIGADEDATLLEAVRQSKAASTRGSHSGGTKGVSKDFSLKLRLTII